MSMFGYVLVKFFMAICCLGGFLIMLVGAGMIEHPSNMVSFVGMLTCCMGIMSFVWFGVLLAREDI